MSFFFAILSVLTFFVAWFMQIVLTATHAYSASISNHVEDYDRYFLIFALLSFSVVVFQVLSLGISISQSRKSGLGVLNSGRLVLCCLFLGIDLLLGMGLYHFSDYTVIHTEYLAPDRL
jgi:hypothetical protein